LYVHIYPDTPFAGVHNQQTEKASGRAFLHTGGVPFNLCQQIPRSLLSRYHCKLKDKMAAVYSVFLVVHVS